MDLRRRKKRKERRSSSRENNAYDGIGKEMGSDAKATDPGTAMHSAEHRTTSRRKKQKKNEKMRIEMRQAPRRRKRRRRSGHSNTFLDIAYKFLLVAAIICAVLFAFTVFFEIKDIKVDGNEKYSATEIIAATGINEGDKLLFINKFESTNMVYEKLPYIDEIKITRRPPSGLLIEVKESEVAVCLQNGGMTYLIDKNCKLLDFYPTDSTVIDAPIVKCSEVSEPVAGKEIAFVESYMLQALKDSIAYILNDEIAPKVTELSIEKLYDINFMYEDRLKVVIGESTDIEKKILYFKTVVQDIGTDESGTVNMKNPERTIFRPSTAGGEK